MKQESKFKHVFFDLDRTLWDFEINSKETLSDIFLAFKLKEKGVPSLEDFINNYQIHNEALWKLYRKDNIKKEELRSKRFNLTLKAFNIYNEKLAFDIGEQYVRDSPVKTKLFPFTIEVLEYLYKSYDLHIITNGFQEVQYVKLSNSNILKYFRNIVTSEEVGKKKPSLAIFNYALRIANANINNSVMIGDDLDADIIGAKSLGLDQIYFNPKKYSHNQQVTYEIACLSELMSIL